MVDAVKMHDLDRSKATTEPVVVSGLHPSWALMKRKCKIIFVMVRFLLKFDRPLLI
jgi:hypothetical protein